MHLPWSCILWPFDGIAVCQLVYKILVLFNAKPPNAHHKLSNALIAGVAIYVLCVLKSSICCCLLCFCMQHKYIAGWFFFGGVTLVHIASAANSVCDDKWRDDSHVSHTTNHLPPPVRLCGEWAAVYLFCGRNHCLLKIIHI